VISCEKKGWYYFDEELVFRAREVALSHGQSLSKILEDALKMYLLTVDRGKLERQKDISQITRGSMRVPQSVLKAVMEEEDNKNYFL